MSLAILRSYGRGIYAIEEFLYHRNDQIPQIRDSPPPPRQLPGSQFTLVVSWGMEVKLGSLDVGISFKELV